MGKFSFDRDYSKRVSMHRDNEQHKNAAKISVPAKIRFSRKKSKIRSGRKQKTCNAGDKTPAATVPGLSDEEIIQQLNMLTEAFRATNGREEEKALRDFAAQYHLNLRVEAAVSKTDKSAIARMVLTAASKSPSAVIRKNLSIWPTIRTNTQFIPEKQKIINWKTRRFGR